MIEEKIPPEVAKQIDAWCRDTWSLSHVQPLPIVLRSIFYQGFQLGAQSAHEILVSGDGR